RSARNETRSYAARQYRSSMHGVQESELCFDEEQEENTGSARVQEILQPVPGSQAAQRDEVSELPICDFRLPIEKARRRASRQLALANRLSAQGYSVSG